MPIMDVFRVNQIKAELEEVRRERDTLRATLTSTEHMTHHDLVRAIEELKEKQEIALRAVSDAEAEVVKRRQTLERQLAELERQIEIKRTELNKEFAEKRKELVQMDEEILLQSFGFYQPRYNLMNSDAYKARLEAIRQQQAEMVKSGRAASASTNWTVNNSQKEGERMTKDYVKLILRSFNNECDASIVTVKFNNVDTIEKRIRKAFETLNTLGKRMTIALSPTYLELKLQELYLCHEYQMKKQQEKEEQKLLREQMREEAKLLKEIEEMKLRLGKEETHFLKALNGVNERLQRANTDTERQLLEEEKRKIEGQLAQLEEVRNDIRNREQNTRAGYVYIISNVGAFGEDVYKIGVTRRLDPQERIDELGDASVPFDFDIHALIFSDDAPGLESALHRAFEQRRLNMINRRREFFRVTLDEIKQVITSHFKKPVEFIDLAEAEEYRQSLLLKQGVSESPVMAVQ